MFLLAVRRRPVHLLSIALGLASACNDDVPPSEETDGTTSSASGTDDTTSTTGGETTSAPTTTADTSSDTTTTGEPALLDEYPLEGDEMYPEGVAFDPTARAFYVGSLIADGITRVNADGTQSVFVASNPTMLACAGMKVDAAARRLWVCGSDDTDSSRVYVYDLDDAGLIETFELDLLVPEASCNDLALDADGVAYVTDPPSAAIHRLAIGGDATLWATDPELDAELMSLGLNGIAVTPDGSAVIVTKFISKRLLRVAIDDPTQITEVALGGDDFAGGSLVAGPDGIVFRDDTLFVVFDDVVARVAPNADWSAAEVTILDAPTTGLSTATVAEGEIYVVKSEVTAFALGSAPELPFRISRVTTD